jgi:exoribonuclease-2
MLPERLSTDLTSLNEGQERLAIVVEMLVAADGNIEAEDVYRARVFNHAKLAYNSVAAWLEGEVPCHQALPRRWP